MSRSCVLDNQILAITDVLDELWTLVWWWCGGSHWQSSLSCSLIKVAVTKSFTRMGAVWAALERKLKPSAEGPPSHTGSEDRKLDLSSWGKWTPLWGSLVWLKRAIVNAWEENNLLQILFHGYNREGNSYLGKGGLSVRIARSWVILWSCESRKYRNKCRC